MSPEKSISRRDFIRISIGGLAALGMGKYLLPGETSPKADLVFHGSPVLTVDSVNSIRGAVAVKGNRIMKTARNLSELRDLIGPGTKLARIPKGCVTPGIIDVHNHIVAQSTTTINWVDLIRCNSVKSVRETLARWIIENQWPPGKWVRGIGYMWLWDKIFSHARGGLGGAPLVERGDLDQVVQLGGKTVDLGKYPIYLVQLSGHYASANAMALLKSRIMNENGGFYLGSDSGCLTCPGRAVGQTFSPEAHAFGSFFHTRNGKLDGMIFHHYAMEEFLARSIKFAGFPRLDAGEMNQALKKRCREFIQMGVTSIYDNNLRAMSLVPAVKAFPGHASNGEKLRITLYPYICHLNKGAFPAFDTGSRRGVTSIASPFKGDWMRLIGYKLQIDAAAMTGFTWEPNRSIGDMTKGKLNLWEYRDYLEIVKSLDRMGAQVSIHVVGDRALDWTLDSCETAGIGGKSRRLRIEHLPCVPELSRNSITGKTSNLYTRSRDLGVVFCPQPGFIFYYAPFFDSIFGAGLGKKQEAKVYRRVTHSIPYRSAVEAGIPVALSSDNPCVPNPSPLVALWESCHRRTRRMAKGSQVILDSYLYNHPDEKGVVYDERVDFNQALRGHTIDAAYCGFEEKEKGSLEPGKLADLVIWNQDIRRIGGRIPIGRIQDMKPVLTLIDGKVAFHDTSSGVRFEKA